MKRVCSPVCRTPSITEYQVLNAHRSLLIPAVTLAALLAACGGGHGSALPSVGASGNGASSDYVSATSNSTSTSAPAVVQKSFNGTSGNATSLSVALAHAPLLGDTVVAFIGTGDASAIVTPPAGWSAAKDAKGNACRTTGAAETQGEQVFIHRVSATESGSYAFTFSSNTSYAVGLVEAQYVSATAPIDACAGAMPPKNSSTGTVTAATLTPSAAGELPLAGYAPSTSGMTDTPKSGWSNGLYNNTKTKWMTLDAESGPPTTTTAVTPSTTFGNLGSTTIVYAPSVDILLAPSTTATTTASAGPAVAQTALTGTNGNTTSISATLGKAPAAGNVLVAFIGTGDSSTVATAPAGWSAAKDAKGNLCQMNGVAGAQGERVYVHPVASGDGAGPYTFTFSANTAYAIGLLELQNVSVTAPVDACAGTQPPSGTTTGTVTAVSLVPSVSDDLPIVGYAPSTSGLSDMPNAGWSKNLYNATQTPYMTLDIEGGPLATAGTPVAPSTTFGNLGGTNIVFAPSVNVLFAPSSPTLTMTSPAIVSTTAPTTAPTASPSPSPTPTPVCCTNATQWPATFTPYAPTSVWNKPISNITSPTLFANSDSIVQHAMTASSSQQLWATDVNLSNGCSSSCASDPGHPWYFATNNDPVVSTNCTLNCGHSVSSIHIPAKARPANVGGDRHIAVVQPDGTEVDMWAANYPGGDWGTSGNTTITAATVNTCGNFYTGPGFTGNTDSSTVGDACLMGGLIRENEAVGDTVGDTGTIHHALFITMQCGTRGSYVYPAMQQFDNACGDGQPSFYNGAHLWSDYTDAQVDALYPGPAGSSDAVTRAILKAMHHYGGYLLDSGGGAAVAGQPNFFFEDSAQYTSVGATSPWLSFGAANGWGVATGGAFGTAKYTTFSDAFNPLSSVGGWPAHLHWIDPCYAQGTC